MKKQIKIRPMTDREIRDMFLMLLLLVEVMIAAMQGVAWVFFDLLSGEAYLFAALILAPLLAFAWTRSMDSSIEIDETDEVGA